MNNDSAYMAYLKKILKLRVYPPRPFFRCRLILQSPGWGFGSTHVLIIFLRSVGTDDSGLDFDWARVLSVGGQQFRGKGTGEALIFFKMVLGPPSRRRRPQWSKKVRFVQLDVARSLIFNFFRDGWFIPLNAEINPSDGRGGRR